MEVDLKTISGMEVATSTTFAPPSAIIRPPRSPKRKRFKSRTDINKRYSVRKVTISEAKMVNLDELAKMTLVFPRTKTTDNPSPSNGRMPSASPSNTSPPTGSTSSSSNKTSTVGTSSKASAKSGSKKPKRKPKKRRKPKAPV
ncbi:hypothetical protein BGZ97_010998, partial [Linnemannia gamsii]